MEILGTCIFAELEEVGGISGTAGRRTSTLKSKPPPSSRAHLDSPMKHRIFVEDRFASAQTQGPSPVWVTGLSPTERNV